MGEALARREMKVGFFLAEFIMRYSIAKVKKSQIGQLLERLDLRPILSPSN